MTSDEDILWKTKNYEKCKSIDKIIARFKSLQSVKREFKAKLKELEETNKRTFIELCSYKAEIENKNNTIKKIRANLKLKEEELCDIRGKFNDALSYSELNFECTELANTGSNKKHTKEKCLLEQEVQCNKLKAVCERLRETNIAFDVTKSIMNDDIRWIKDTVMNMTRKLEEAGNNREHDMAIRVQQIQEENRVKDEEIRRMKNVIDELQRQNGYNVSTIDKQNKLLLENKCKNIMHWIGKKKL